MFETYLVHQEVDPRIRRRFVFALSAAVVATLSSGVMLWTMEKMHITRVGAPTSDFLIFALDEFVPPPREEPPQRLGGQIEDEDEDVEEPPEEDFVEPTQPQKVPDDIPKAKTSAQDVLAHVGGGGGGSPIGLPNGDPNSKCLINCSPVVRTPVTGGGDNKPPPEVKFSALQCRVCPDPDQKALQRTSAALVNPRPLINKTHFCVESDGKVSSVSVRHSSGDEEVDRIIKKTVAGWRFAPMMVDDRARKACSVASFDIRFE